MLSCIGGLKLPFSRKVVQHRLPDEPNWSNREIESLKNSINELLSIGAISECDSCDGQFVSKIFLVPKPDGSMRLILNLKQLNTFIEATHFKLEDKSTVMRLLQKGYFMTKLDLKNAYYLVPIHESHRKFLRFQFLGKLFQFNCLCFGLNIAPFVFTKIIKPIVTLLRSKGFLLVAYLDDFLLLGKSKKQCLDNVCSTISLMERLGFVINYRKSCLFPSTKIEYLGLIFDSETLTVGVPLSKQDRIDTLLSAFLHRSSSSIRFFAHLIGVLVSVCPATPYGLSHTKLLERIKYLALLKSGGNFDSQMYIPHSVKNDLLWWRKNIKNSRAPIRNYSFVRTIFTDASLSGWGAVCGMQKTSGNWNPFEKGLHINELELLAVLFGLKCFTKDLSDCEILLRVDNTTAIAYINRMGGIQFPKLNAIAQKIWGWCEKQKIWVYASYIKSSDNILADRESRKLPCETEWSLSANAFSIIKSTFGTPDIDLFANRCNKKCKNFISWLPDPDAVTVDAFTLSWKPFFFYAFPPFILILKVIRKIITDEAEGILVVPFWPSQPWYPLFSNLLVTEPVVLQPDINLLSLPNRSHPLWRTLSLVAGRLSGKPSRQKGYRPIL